MKHAKTTLSLLGSIGLIAPTHAAISVVADYDFSTFADGTADLTTAGFDVINGSTTISGGELVLDRPSGGLSDTTSPLTANDNFIMEGIMTLDATTGPGFDFDFFFSNSVGVTNSGFGIVHEGNGADNYVGINMGSAGIGTGPTAYVSETVAVAFVRESGVSRIFLDGVEIGTLNSPGFTPAVSRFNIGWNPADGTNGNAGGTVQRVRLSTFTTFDSNDLLAVPEPSSTALLGLGGLALMFRRRKI